MSELRLMVDAERGRPGSKYRAWTGIYVRAFYDERWDSFDIATLAPASLLTWLRSRGGENAWAEWVVGSLLEYSEAELAVLK